MVRRPTQVSGRRVRLLANMTAVGLLVIPHIGRKKYSVSYSYCGPQFKLFGRNMLLGQWIWLDYCARLPPGFEPDEKMMRVRKMVSSHIQVLKGIFKDHKFCK